MKRPAITAKLKLAVIAKTARIPCAHCLQIFSLDQLQFDHHLALIDGGTHDAENLRPLCVSCHRPKSSNEHRANSKAKRLALARLHHAAVLRGERIREPGAIRSRPFDNRWTRKLNGRVVRNADA